MPVKPKLKRLTAEQQELVEKNVHLAYYILNRLKFKLRMDYDEAASVALHTLCKCAANFDPGKGWAFTTYAGQSIKLELCRENYRGHIIKIPEYLLKPWESLHEAKKLKASGAPGARNAVENRKRLLATADKVRSVKHLKRGESDGDDWWLAGRDPDPSAAVADDEMRQIRIQMVQDALKRMPERHAMVLRLRMEGCSLQTTGEKMGVTRERIRQLEAKARIMLKRQLRRKRLLKEALRN